MFWRNWIPPELIDDEQVMSEDLINLRDWVIHHRDIDITLPLYIYEYRVLLSDIQMVRKEPVCTWKEIRNDIDSFEYSSDQGIYIYKPTNREMKKCLLVGWMETMLWAFGKNIEQFIFPIPNQLNNITVPVQESDQFLKNLPLDTSFILLQNFYKKYFQNIRGHLLQDKGNDRNWDVFVPPDLWFFYFLEYKKEPDHAKKFDPIPHELKTIKLALNNEFFHIAVANFIAWQTFFYFCHCQRKGIRMKSTIQNQSMISEIKNLPENMQHVVYQLAENPSICRLNEADRNLIDQCFTILPKQSRLKRFIQYMYHREKIARQCYFAQRKKMKQDAFKQLLREKWLNFVQYISYPWVPAFAGQAINASSLPKDDHTWFIDNGQVDISCMWKGAIGDDPAYIYIKWIAKINTVFEIWVAFFNPETKRFFSEIKLGINLVGNKIIMSNQLNFDPINERWAVSIILKKIERNAA